MPDRRLEPPRAGVQSAGQSQITRRRLFAKAGDVALGACAASSPFLTGCAQAAPATAVPTTAAAPSGGRAPFQIMALRDLAVPSSLQALRVPDAKDRPLSGSYGRPHVMNRSLVAFAYDRALLYDGDATPPWTRPDLDSLKTRIYGQALYNISGPDFNGVLFINGEGSHWHEVDGKGDNAWRAVDTLEGVDRAIPICVSWVEALRQVCPRALMAWYAKPAGAEFNRSLAYLQEIAPRQAPLLESLDILRPASTSGTRPIRTALIGLSPWFAISLPGSGTPTRISCCARRSGRSSCSWGHGTTETPGSAVRPGRGAIGTGRRSRPTTARPGRRPAPNRRSAGRSGTVCLR